MVDPLILTGVFMLGASAGALLTHVRHRSLLNRCEEVLQGVYDSCMDSGITEAKSARPRPTSQVRIQTVPIAQTRGQLNPRNSQRSVIRASALTERHDTARYGDQRLAR